MPVTIRTNAPAAAVVADAARRTITGMVAPWGIYARVSTGQTVAFARGALTLSERAKLVLDHDPGRPVAVYLSASDTEDGLIASFRVPAGERGDAILAEAGDGLRDGLSVSAELDTFAENKDGSIWVTAAKGRHVALLSEPAYDTARVTDVAAQAPTTGGIMTDTATPTAPTPPVDVSAGPAAASPAGPAPQPVTLTAAGQAAVAAGPAAPPGPAARTQDPYPYAQPLEMGGPSFVRDAWAAMENPGSPEADRWRRAQLMASDPAIVHAGLARMARLAAPPADLMAAPPATTVTNPGLVPTRWLPERYVPLRGAKAPLYTALAKYSTPDFSTLEVPRTGAETGLSGKPADEVTPIATGTVTVTTDTVSIDEVEGAYSFSRKLLMGSNPQIDRIASDAMDRAWLADVEARAVTFFTAAGHFTAAAAAYVDGAEYIAALRGIFATLSAATLYEASDVIPAAAEYIAAAEADDSTGRALLPYGPQVNSSGTSSAAYASVSVQGVPLWPGPYMPAKSSFVLDQSIPSAVVFATPVMDFRLEWTTDVATGGNVKVLKLVKYSGVGFWAQQPGGIVLVSNSTDIGATPPPLDDGDEARTARTRK